MAWVEVTIDKYHETANDSDLSGDLSKTVHSPQKQTNSAKPRQEDVHNGQEEPVERSLTDSPPIVERPPKNMCPLAAFLQASIRQAQKEFAILCAEKEKMRQTIGDLNDLFKDMDKEDCPSTWIRKEIRISGHTMKLSQIQLRKSQLCRVLENQSDELTRHTSKCQDGCGQVGQTRANANGQPDNNGDIFSDPAAGQLLQQHSLNSLIPYLYGSNDPTTMAPPGLVKPQARYGRPVHEPGQSLGQPAQTGPILAMSGQPGQLPSSSSAFQGINHYYQHSTTFRLESEFQQQDNTAAKTCPPGNYLSKQTRPRTIKQDHEAITVQQNVSGQEEDKPANNPLAMSNKKTGLTGQAFTKAMSTGFLNMVKESWKGITSSTSLANYFPYLSTADKPAMSETDNESDDSPRTRYNSVSDNLSDDSDGWVTEEETTVLTSVNDNAANGQTSSSDSFDLVDEGLDSLDNHVRPRFVNSDSSSTDSDMLDQMRKKNWTHHMANRKRRLDAQKLHDKLEELERKVSLLEMSRY